MRRDRLEIWALRVWLIAAAWAVVIALMDQAGYRINETPSVPIGLWQVTALTGPLKRGAVVSFCLPDTPAFKIAGERGYLSKGHCPSGFQPMLKPVAAVAGDIIAIDEAGLSVNGALIPNSRALMRDRRGNPMPRVAFGSAVVPPGAVWLVSSANPLSFDSRYFGPLEIARINSVAKPIWIWQ